MFCCLLTSWALVHGLSWTTSTSFTKKSKLEALSKSRCFQTTVHGEASRDNKIDQAATISVDIMVYINSGGEVGGSRKRKGFGLSLIRDFIVGIFDFIGLFFRTLTASPSTLEAERGQRRTTYAQRQGIRGPGGGGGGGRSNVRGVCNLGTARGGGGG